jgi:hypothetical protein
VDGGILRQHDAIGVTGKHGRGVAGVHRSRVAGRRAGDPAGGWVLGAVHADAGVPGGEFRFTVVTDDGSRLWIDDQLVIDAWTDQPPTTYTADPGLSAGDHTVRYEFDENGGGETAQLSWVFAPELAASAAMVGPASMPRRRDLPEAKPWPFPAARSHAGGFAERQTRLRLPGYGEASPRRGVPFGGDPRV